MWGLKVESAARSRSVPPPELSGEEARKAGRDGQIAWFVFSSPIPRRTGQARGPCPKARKITTDSRLGGVPALPFQGARPPRIVARMIKRQPLVPPRGGTTATIAFAGKSWPIAGSIEWDGRGQQRNGRIATIGSGTSMLSPVATDPVETRLLLLWVSGPRSKALDTHGLVPTKRGRVPGNARATYRGKCKFPINTRCPAV